MTHPLQENGSTPAFSTFRREFDSLRKLLLQVRDQALELLASFHEGALSQAFSRHPQKIIR